MTRKTIISTMTIAFVFSNLFLNGCVYTKGTAKPNPILAHQYLEEGKILEKKGDLTEAHEQYKLALAVDPKNAFAGLLTKELTRKISKLADIHFKFGAKYLREKNYGLARKELLTALKYQPNHSKAYKMLISMQQNISPNYVKHTIQEGETLAFIAQNYYGDYKKHTTIARFNNIEDSSQVKPGRIIMIPVIRNTITSGRHAGVEKKTSGFVWHIIQPGQSTSKLAQLYYRDPKKFYIIRRYNGMHDATQVKVGDRLKIPKVDGLPFDAPAPNTKNTAVPVSKASKADKNKPQPDEPITVPSPLPDSRGEKEAFAYRDTGIEHLNRNDFSSAIKQFEKYLQAMPDDDEGRNLLSKAYFQKALSDYNKRDFIAAMKGFKSALEYNSQCKKCSEHINQSLESYKEAHYNKGIVYYAEQQLAQAVSEWEMVYEFDPNYKDVEKKLNKARILIKNLEKIKKSRQS